MKTINVTIALLMFLQATLAFATPAKSEAIGYSLDKFQYEAEVGTFKSESEIKEAAANLVADLKAEGVSESEIMDHVRNNLLTADQKADFDLMMTALKRQNASSEEYVAQVSNYFQNTQVEGSSYRRTTIYIVPTGVFLLGVGIYVVLVLLGADCHRDYYGRCRRSTVVVY